MCADARASANTMMCSYYDHNVGEHGEPQFESEVSLALREYLLAVLELLGWQRTSFSRMPPPPPSRIYHDHMEAARRVRTHAGRHFLCGSVRRAFEESMLFS